ncbi:type II toxin-antitoxin system Phd/YefM family antitoxin [Gordonia sp. OPL2]|uniref:type II toxin-antitoxin system Phd/YefM family antitoxin n=1 Tax=Gordonia sp. OPL2 TaxID=2486274 RepID=UPI00165615FE|nr:type II toxin-antitoxin system prevent-host-death family antitoxin [Gordonia sp. OPL2]RPA06171.1 type II toxin-antitoxin system prevent-host-death family antitoxin [Gordonia sp. OPL2]
MRTVSKRQLNQQTAAVLDQVSDTDDVVVTERGKPRWRISAVTVHGSTLARLEREGRYTPASSDPAPWPDQTGGRKYTDAEVEALLDEMRGDH